MWQRQIPTFHGILLPSSSGSSSPQKRVLGIFDTKDDKSVIFDMEITCPKTQFHIPEDLHHQKHCSRTSNFTSIFLLDKLTVVLVLNNSLSMNYKSWQAFIILNFVFEIRPLIFYWTSRSHNCIHPPTEKLMWYCARCVYKYRDIISTIEPRNIRICGNMNKLQTSTRMWHWTAKSQQWKAHYILWCCQQKFEKHCWPVGRRKQWQLIAEDTYSFIYNFILFF